MLSDTLHDELNQQVKHEFDSAYVYLSMSLWFRSRDLPGMASWMHAQHAEEIEHGMKFVEFIEDRGGRVTLDALAKPQAEFGSPLEAFEAALEHERFITGRIDGLYDLAVKENDRPAQVFLQWFVTEQVEEEKSVGGAIARIKLAGDDNAALLMIDHELGEREAGG